LGYSATSRGIKFTILRNQTVNISIHVVFDGYDEPSQLKENEDTEVPTLQNVDNQNIVSTLEKEDDQNV